MARLQDYPAEGSREMIERELARSANAVTPANAAAAPAASAGDVVRLLGDLDAARTAEILALAPSLDELEQAAAWVEGEGDRPAREGQPLAGKAAAIFDIVAAEEDDEP